MTGNQKAICRIVVWWFALAVLTACTSYAPVRLDTPAELIASQTQEKNGVTVSAALLSDEQAYRHFGVPLADHDIQALWIKVENDSPNELWFIRNVVDKDFYPADEVALMVDGDVPDQDFDRMRQALRDEEIRAFLMPGMITEGFVFLPRSEGGRYVDIRLFDDARVTPAADSSSNTPQFRELLFGFALTLPSGEFDYERLDTSKTYAGEQLPDLDRAELRTTLEALPCCTTENDGERNGDPLNVVLVGDGVDVLNALSRSGWSFTHQLSFKSIRREMAAAIAGNAYSVAPVSNLYLFGRKQDIALQRARNSITQRNHMRLWLAPFRHKGKQVWAGQVSRDVGVKFTTKSSSLTTHVIDPAVDVTRLYLLDSLLAEGLVKRFGFVKGSVSATREQPATNLTDDPYFSDGLRLVVVLSHDPLPYNEVGTLHWEHAAAPFAEGQSRDADRNVRPIDASNQTDGNDRLTEGSKAQ